MSFILDALRKSENERRQQAAPALAAAPQPAPVEKRNIWIPILSGVLAANVLLVGYFVMTRGDSDDEINATADNTEVRSLRKESIVEPVPEPLPEQRPAADLEFAAPEPVVAAINPAPVPPIPVVPFDPTPVAPSPLREAAAMPEPTIESEPAAVQDGLPSLSQVRSSGQVSIGELRVDMHVYAGDPAKRFVFMNMKKYREGDQLDEGPLIESITPDGVVLQQGITRFRVDRD